MNTPSPTTPNTPTGTAPLPVQDIPAPSPAAIAGHVYDPGRIARAARRWSQVTAAAAADREHAGDTSPPARRTPAALSAGTASGPLTLDDVATPPDGVREPVDLDAVAAAFGLPPALLQPAPIVCMRCGAEIVDTRRGWMASSPTATNDRARCPRSTLAGGSHVPDLARPSASTSAAAEPPPPAADPFATPLPSAPGEPASAVAEFDATWGVAPWRPVGPEPVTEDWRSELCDLCSWVAPKHAPTCARHPGAQLAVEHLPDLVPDVVPTPLAPPESVDLDIAERLGTAYGECRGTMSLVRQWLADDKITAQEAVVALSVLERVLVALDGGDPGLPEVPARDTAGDELPPAASAAS